jgi:hypothetical protein
MSGRPRIAEFLRKRLGTHVRIKAGMFAVACLIWLFVRLDQTTSIVVPVPVRVDLSALPGKVLLTPPPDKLSVTLQGRGRSLLGFVLFHEGEYLLRPQDHQSQSHATEVTNLYLSGRPDLTVMTLSPALLNLELDEELIRTVPITVRAKVEAAEGYRLREPVEPRPRTVEVRGPRRLLDTLGTVYTDADDLSRLRKDLNVGVALSLPFHQARLQVSSVVLSARVERLAERRFDRVPLKVSHNRERLEVTPAELAVVVYGSEEELADLEPEQIKAVLDLDLREPDQSQMPCRVSLPKGFELKETLPPAFRIGEPADPDSSRSRSRRRR